MTELPDRIGRYPILAAIGRGGFSEVFLAEDCNLDVRVAVKILAREYVSNDHVTRRFNNEARLMRRLEGDGIVRVYELGEHDGRPFFVMEYCERGSLLERQRALDRRLTVAEAEGLVRALGDALGRVHGFDPPLVHRDIKPANLLFRTLSPGNREPVGELLAADEQLLVGDFGLAKIVSNETAEPTIVAFTRGYASPEQVRGEPTIDPRTDLYSASAVVVAALSGCDPNQVFGQDDVAFPDSALEATGPLRSGLERGLAYNRDDRPADTSEWVESILGRKETTALTRIGRYPVEAWIDDGGFSDVYLVTDTHLNTRVAVKILKADVIENPDMVRRFNDEARFTRGLEGDGIVRIYDVGEHEGRPFFVMDYCDRGSLQGRLTDLGRPLREAEGVGLVQALGDTLRRVHSFDPPLVHRDIKPKNLLIRRAPSGAAREPVGQLLGADEQLVLADFGLAKIVSPGSRKPTIQAGSWGYASPEQVKGLPSIDARADLYSASAVVVSACSGEKPKAVTAADDRAFSEDALGATGALRPGLEQGLAFDRDERPPDVTSWVDGVLAPLVPAPTEQTGRSGTTAPPDGRRRSLVALGLGVGAMAAGAVAAAATILGGPRIEGPSTGHVGDEVAFYVDGPEVERWIFGSETSKAEVLDDGVLVASWDDPTTVAITAVTDEGEVSFDYTATEQPSELRILGPGYVRVGDPLVLSVEGQGGDTATWTVSSSGGDETRSLGANVPLQLQPRAPGLFTVAVAIGDQRAERAIVVGD